MSQDFAPTAELTRIEFRRSLALGTGHAGLHIEKVGLAGFEDDLFDALTFSRTPDPQCAPCPASWLLDRCEQAGVLAAWIPRIVALTAGQAEGEVENDGASWHDHQRLRVAYHLIRRGHREARALFDSLLCSGNWWLPLGSEEAVALDGVDGFRRVLQRLLDKEEELDALLLTQLVELVVRRAGIGAAQAILAELGIEPPPVREPARSEREDAPRRTPRTIEDALDAVFALTDGDSAKQNGGPYDYSSGEFRAALALKKSLYADQEGRRLRPRERGAGHDLIEAALLDRATRPIHRRVLLEPLRKLASTRVRTAILGWVADADDELLGAIGSAMSTGHTAGARAAGIRILETSSGNPVRMTAALDLLRHDALSEDLALVMEALRKSGSERLPSPEDEGSVPKALLELATSAQGRGLDATPLFRASFLSLPCGCGGCRQQALRGFVRSGGADIDLLRLALFDVNPGTRGLASWAATQCLGGQRSRSGR